MMNPFSIQLFLSVLVFSSSASTVYSQLSEWRGPDRAGIYNETGLMKQWPEGCPELLWKAGNIFLISGSGDIVCVGSDGKIKWSKNHYSLYESEPKMFGISESPLVVDNMVIASPGGKKASLVFFSIKDGKVVWETEALNQGPQYVNPKLVKYAGKKMIVTVMEKDIVAIDVWENRNFDPQHGGVVLLGNNILIKGSFISGMEMYLLCII